MINKVNIWNVAENLMYVLGGVIIGAAAVMFSQKATLKTVQPTFDKAIEKATNEITNKIEVPKIKKSEGVQLILTPDNQQIAVQDTCMWGDISKLSENRQRRINRWLEEAQ